MRYEPLAHLIPTIGWQFIQDTVRSRNTYYPTYQNFYMKSPTSETVTGSIQLACLCTVDKAQPRIICESHELPTKHSVRIKPSNIPSSSLHTKTKIYHPLGPL